ncbi:hypothetical protein PsYK624_067100 [Phanerochaete sordida]|uniref:Uncharacterized protein n=1 Tax=Phanerochaete sordida TaxID=48140 RepID=A0A9P3LE35_9APHY|nr:hypothetical protein PsYK624_067100 [Phanerochaete sordida]
MSNIKPPAVPHSKGPGCGVYFIQNVGSKAVMDMHQDIHKIPVYLRPKHKLKEQPVPQQLWVVTRARLAQQNFDGEDTYQFENASICSYLRSTSDVRYLHCGEPASESSQEWLVAESTTYPGTYTYAVAPLMLRHAQLTHAKMCAAGCGTGTPDAMPRPGPSACGPRSFGVCSTPKDKHGSSHGGGHGTSIAPETSPAVGCPGGGGLPGGGNRPPTGIPGGHGGDYGGAPSGDVAVGVAVAAEDASSDRSILWMFVPAVCDHDKKGDAGTAGSV